MYISTYTVGICIYLDVGLGVNLDVALDIDIRECANVGTGIVYHEYDDVGICVGLGNISLQV